MPTLTQLEAKDVALRSVLRHECRRLDQTVPEQNGGRYLI